MGFICENSKNLYTAKISVVHVSFVTCLPQVPAGEVILVRQECLPGYSPSEDECVCEETDKILLCDPNREGVLLAVSVLHW